MTNMEPRTRVTPIEQEIPSLASIADGAVCEAFEFELQKILNNINDPSTDPNSKREINIKIVFAPVGEEREEVRVAVQCSSKTVSHKPIETLFWLTPMGQQIGCTEVKRRQTTLADYGYPD
jgi:hypothetical protein